MHLHKEFSMDYGDKCYFPVKKRKKRSRFYQKNNVNKISPRLGGFWLLGILWIGDLILW